MPSTPTRTTMAWPMTAMFRVRCVNDGRGRFSLIAIGPTLRTGPPSPDRGNLCPRPRTRREDAGTGQGGHGFKRHWHHRRLELANRDVLTWLVVDRPGRGPFIAYFRGDRRGGVHEDNGYRLLAEHGHPDAGIPRARRARRLPLRDLGIEPTPHDLLDHPRPRSGNTSRWRRQPSPLSGEGKSTTLMTPPSHSGGSVSTAHPPEVLGDSGTTPNRQPHCKGFRGSNVPGAPRSIAPVPKPTTPPNESAAA